MRSATRLEAGASVFSLGPSNPSSDSCSRLLIFFSMCQDGCWDGAGVLTNPRIFPTGGAETDTRVAGVGNCREKHFHIRTAGVLKTRMAVNTDLAWEFSPIQGSLLQGELKEIERAAPVLIYIYKECYDMTCLGTFWYKCWKKFINTCKKNLF